MTQKRKILIFENSYTLTNYLLTQWSETSWKAIEEKGSFCAALSGGRSPVEFYSKLAGLSSFDIWKKTHIFQTDERFVSQESRDNNFYHLKLNLLNDIHIPQDNIHPVNTSFQTVEESMAQYARELKNFFSLNQGEYPIFDCIVLGLGQDGHVASVFADDAGAQDTDKIVIATNQAHGGYQRISLTLPVLNAAKQIFFIVKGSPKADIVRSLFVENADLPASRVCPAEGEMVFLLDKDATAQLDLTENYQHQGEALAFEI